MDIKRKLHLEMLTAEKLNNQLQETATENGKLRQELQELKLLINSPLSSRFDGDYRNWIRCTLAMTDAKNTIGPFVEEVFKEPLELSKTKFQEMLAKSNGSITPADHAHTWSDVKQNRSQHFFINCNVCDGILQYLMKKLQNPKEFSPKNCKMDALFDEHWPLAKAFMTNYPYIDDSHSTKDVDAMALIDVLHRCPLFKWNDPLYKTLKQIRNKLMHTPDQKVSTADMEYNVHGMIQWLNADFWNTHQECKEMRDKLDMLIGDRAKTHDNRLEKTDEKRALEIILKSLKEETVGNEAEHKEAVHLKLLINKTDQLLRENEIDTMTEDLTESKKTISDLENEIEKELTKQETLKKQMETLVTEKQSMEKQKRQSDHEKSLLLEHNENLKAQVQDVVGLKMKEDLSKKEKEISDFEDKINAVVCKKDILNAQMDKIVREKQNLEQRKLQSERDKDLLVQHYDEVVAVLKGPDLKDAHHQAIPQVLGENLLQNPCAQSGMEGWEVTKSGGDGWIVEDEAVGCQPVQEAIEDAEGSSCWTTSYDACEKKQMIDLLRFHRIEGDFMDVARPDIKVSDWVGVRTDAGCEYWLTVRLLDVNLEEIDRFDVEEHKDKSGKWSKIEHTFSGYGPGVRFVEFLHGGKDDCYWEGHFGAKMTCSSVSVVRPTHRPV